MERHPLFDWIQEGDFEAVDRYLTEHPEQVTMKNLAATEDDFEQWDSISPLHAAGKYGHLDLVKLLMAKGAEVYSNPWSTYPAVIVAAWAGHQDVVDYFINDIPEQAAGTGGLGIACNLAGRQGWTDLVRKHLDRDPLVIHQRGWIGDTPLHWPSHNGHKEIVMMLLEAGADPNAHENGCYGGTPLHWASERNAEIVELLLAHGADVNARVTLQESGFLGATAMVWNAQQSGEERAECIRVLLAAGADASIPDAKGRTALDYAKEHAKKEIVALLEG